MNMKHRLLLIILSASLLFCFPSPSIAQEEIGFSKFEISASIGMVLSGGPINGNSPSSLPLVYDLTFRYFPKMWLSLGLAFGNSHNLYWGEPFYVITTPSVFFHWLKKRAFSVYSGLGYSIPIRKITFPEWSKVWYQGFQYTPIGVTFGHTFYGLAELGFGPRFFPLRLGVGYRF